MKTIHYSCTRLTFKRDEIEPLQLVDIIKIETSTGTYKMTKEEFYTVFDNVIQSKSYKEKGIYHYPVVPEKAKQFLI